jgi:hypothetical protein
MNRTTCYTFFAAVIIGGAFALATHARAAPVDEQATAGANLASERCQARCRPGAMQRQGVGARRARLAHAIQNNPAAAVVVNLRAIERVYWRDGRVGELPAFYREVLTRTDDPLVRNFVNYRLARLERMGGDTQGALQALRRNLDENLGRLSHDG